MRVCGFIRLAPVYPAPVVPILASGDSDRLWFQNIDGDGTIIGFVEVARVPKNRFFLKSHPDYPEAKIGEEALFAVETAEKEVSLRRYSKYEELLRRFLSEEWIDRSPFVAFEIAKGLNDLPMVRRAAERCLTRLSSQSIKLAERWVHGSIDDPSMRDELLDLASSSSELGDLDRANLHYVSPQYLLSIIDRSAARNKRSRAGWIRHAFNPKMFDALAVQSLIVPIADALLGRLEASDLIERPFITWYRTKGKMPVSASTFELFRNLEHTSRSFSYRSNSFVQISKEGVLDSNRGLYTTFLFVCGIAFLDKKVLSDIRVMPVSQVIDKHIFLSVSRVLQPNKTGRP